MFWGEERVHVRGAGCGDAAADGADASPHTADAYGHPVPHYVPSPGRFRHEHPSPTHPQTGQWTEPFIIAHYRRKFSYIISSYSSLIVIFC